MLYFLHKPDAVFVAILYAALESECESIKGFPDDDIPDLWEGCYPESSRYFTSDAGFNVLTELYCAIRDPTVYRPTDYHWLLLYEALQNYCVIHNDLAPTAPTGWRPVGKFKLREIDFDALVGLYFWDTDFLCPPIQGCSPDTESIQLDRIEPSRWGHNTLPDNPVLNPVSLRYPDWEEA
jgi:hypothetical protein